MIVLQYENAQSHRVEIQCVGLGRRRNIVDRGGRQEDRKRRPARPTGEFDVPMTLFDDADDRCQPEPRTFAGPFRREEGLEDLLLQ